MTALLPVHAFWVPGGGAHSAAPLPVDVAEYCVSTAPSAIISHTPVPANINGFTLDAGDLGVNMYANVSLIDEFDILGLPWRFGTVDNVTGLPAATEGGWVPQTVPFEEDFADGLNPAAFNVLLQHASIVDNVDVVYDAVFGTTQAVVRLTATTAQANSTTKYFEYGAILQTAPLFASGSYKIVARFPAVTGVGMALWAFHYEEHYTTRDPEFLASLETSGSSKLNHEIDIEMPATCSGMCGPGKSCAGQFDTANLNNYVWTNPDGTGPAFSNLCTRAPPGKAFVDNEYHTYEFQWHTGSDTDASMPKRVDFFLDGVYIGTNDVFVPTRACRLAIGFVQVHWAGVPTFDKAYAYIANVAVTPYNEPRDASYPQIFDQPDGHPFWVDVTIVPPVYDAATMEGVRQPSWE